METTKSTTTHDPATALWFMLKGWQSEYAFSAYFLASFISHLLCCPLPSSVAEVILNIITYPSLSLPQHLYLSLAVCIPYLLRTDRLTWHLTALWLSLQIALKHAKNSKNDRSIFLLVQYWSAGLDSKEGIAVCWLYVDLAEQSEYLSLPYCG
jgi:hypothetical protein